MFIELDNGESFELDAGPGRCINYQNIHISFSRMIRIFWTHLHTVHTSDLA
jgi:ribonuclease BN (tRNA processing enzyme)